MKDYIQRDATALVTAAIEQFHCGALLLGPRQAGKTWLARHLESAWPAGAVYLDLESPNDSAKVENLEAFASANEHKLIILDEAQHIHGVFPQLKSILDNAIISNQQ